MGFTLADAYVYFKSDSKDLEKGLDSAEQKTKTSVGSMAQMFAGPLVAGVAAAGAAILGVGVAAFSASSDVDKAVDQIGASLGLSADEAAKYGTLIKDLYKNNWGESIEDVGATVEDIAKKFKLAADDPALKTMAENAFRLRDVFGTEVTESTAAAQGLIEEFGLSSQQAFDLIAKGYQRGLDSSGDFLDSLNEYGPIMAANGFSADQMFSIMESGSEAGVLGTDKIMDAMKEMGIILNEGTLAAREAFAAMGMDFDKISGFIRSGDEAWADYFPNIIEGLQSIEDPLERNKAQVAIFGTMAEDLGINFTEGLSAATISMKDMEGAATSLDAKYTNLGSFFEGMWRRVAISASPFTDKLLEIANDAMPAVMGAFDVFDANVGPIMEGVGGTISTVVGAVKGFFGQFATSITTDGSGPLEYWKGWIDTNLPLVQTLFQNILGAIQGFWALFGDEITTVVNNTFTVIFTIIDTTMKTIGDLVTLALQLLTGDWEGAGKTLEGIVTRIWETLNTVVSTQLDSLKTLFTSIDWLAVGSAIIEGVKNGISSGWTALLEWFPDRLSELRDMLPFSEPKDSNSPLYGLGKSGQALIDNITEGAAARIQNLNLTFNAGLGQLAQAQGAGGSGITISTLQVVAPPGADPFETGREIERGIEYERRIRGE